MAQVTLKDVCKVYGADTLVVKDISLAIRDGEFMVLVGPSGCGKSTTLRMVAGLEEITSGTIMIGDKVVNDVEPRARNIAMVFQNYALYPHMTVADNMTFSLRVKKEPKEVIRKRLAEVAEILGLEPYLQRKPKELSGGQRQRVAMGRALVRNPEVFLFDEPLSNLDAKMRVEMRHEIIKMHQRVKATMIYVTHDQVEAMTLGDRICIMEGGVIQQVGEPGFVFDNPNNLFVAGFIGTPPMNLFTGALRMDGGRAVFEGDGMTAALPGGLLENVREHIGRRVALGLRPRAFHGEGDADDGVAWEAVPEISEMLGEESLVHMRIGAQKFIVTMHPQRIPPLNKPVTVRPIMNRAHIFDADSGKNLTLDVDLPGRTSVRRTTA